jgi:hypothetical protein
VVSLRLRRIFFTDPSGCGPFVCMALFHFGQVAGYLTEMCLASRQNDSQFFIPSFSNNLLAILL